MIYRHKNAVKAFIFIFIFLINKIYYKKIYIYNKIRKKYNSIIIIELTWMHSINFYVTTRQVCKDKAHLL